MRVSSAPAGRAVEVICGWVLPGPRRGTGKRAQIRVKKRLERVYDALRQRGSVRAERRAQCGFVGQKRRLRPAKRPEVEQC